MTWDVPWWSLPAWPAVVTHYLMAVRGNKGLELEVTVQEAEVG